MKTGKTEDLKIKVTEKMMVWLQAEAERRSCSLAQVVRDALVIAMEKKPK